MLVVIRYRLYRLVGNHCAGMEFHVAKLLRCYYGKILLIGAYLGKTLQWMCDDDGCIPC